MSITERAPAGIGSNPLVAGLDCETHLVTPEMAADWLTRAQYAFQRPILKGHVERLAHAITSLEWEVTAIKIYEFEGRQHLVDGQHRLSAIVSAGIPVPLVVIRQRATSLNHLRNAYRRLDQVRVRDTYTGLVGSGVHEQVGIHREGFKRFTSALKVLMRGFSNTKTGGNQWAQKDLDTIARGAYQWQDEGRQYLDAAEKASVHFRKRLFSGAPFAIGLVTFRYEPEKAERFWTKVATQANLDQGSGPWHLTQVLASQPLADVSRSAKKIAGCWNAYYEDRTLLREPPASELPGVRIAGTPYRAGQVIREEF